MLSSLRINRFGGNKLLSNEVQAIVSERASPSNPHYSKAIRALVERREELGYSQYDVARLWEKPQSVIAKIELQQRSLSLFEFIEYCQILKMDPVPVISQIHKQMGKKQGKKKPVSRNG